MKIVQIVIAASFLTVSCAPLMEQAQAKGCIKGALVGGVAGHLVHHGVIGAVGGCFVGMHAAHEADKKRMNSANSQPQPHQ